MTDPEELLERAARNEAGEPIYTRVEGTTGQWFATPVDETGSPVTFWASPDTPLADGAFRDAAGNVLMGVVVFADGSFQPTPLDASLRPTRSVAALVKAGVTVSANPDGWPLTPEELDRDEPPPLDLAQLPGWQREPMARVQRDTLGQFRTTRVNTADGGWADVLIDGAGRPVVFEVDTAEFVGEGPSGRRQRAMMAHSSIGLVLLVLDEHGQPSPLPQDARRSPG